MRHGILLDLHTTRGDVSVPFGEPFVLGLDRAARTLTVAIPDDLYDSRVQPSRPAGDA